MGIESILGIRCPTGMKVQALAFDKKAFRQVEAVAWARAHKIPAPKVDESKSYWRIRVADPKGFAFFRWGQAWKPGIRPIYGCPKLVAAVPVRREERAVKVAGKTSGGALNWSEVPSVTTGGKSSFFVAFADGNKYTVVWDRTRNSWMLTVNDGQRLRTFKSAAEGKRYAEETRKILKAARAARIQGSKNLGGAMKASIGRKSNKFTINDRERKMWIDNDEGLYNWWRRESFHTSKRDFIRKHRSRIDYVIRQAIGEKPGMAGKGQATKTPRISGGKARHRTKATRRVARPRPRRETKNSWIVKADAFYPIGDGLYEFIAQGRRVRLFPTKEQAAKIKKKKGSVVVFKHYDAPRT